MTDKKKTLIYWLVVGVLEIVTLLLAIFCIIKFISHDNYLTFFAFCSAGLCVLNGIFMIFHIEKLFNWYYEKSELAVMHNSPEFFATSDIQLAPKEKVYKLLKITTFVLQVIDIVLQTILLVI